jgi:hypothetical protein
MLNFKTYISVLSEATIKHFAHLGLDPENQEHKDLVDAYNSGHSANDPNVPRLPNQVKTVDQLRTSVKPHFEKIQQKRKEDSDDRKAFENGEAKVIHHNPETGAKVTKVTSQAGSCAAGASSTWCTGKRIGGPDMVKQYDTDEHGSYVFHFPKEPKKHLRTIGAYGKWHEPEEDDDEVDNFQDAENHTVPGHEWNRLVKEHGLDKIKHLKGVVRGISISAKDKLNYASELSDNIHSGTATDEDVHHARVNNYLTDSHKHGLLSSSKNISGKTLSGMAYNTKDPEIHKKIVEHPNADTNALTAVAKNTKDPEVHKKIVDHANVDTNALTAIAWNTKDPEVHKKIADHPRAGNYALGGVAYNAKDPEVHNKILEHPNADGYALAGVAWNTKDPEVHNKIVEHPNADGYALSGVAKNTKDPEMHKKILNHPQVAQATKDLIASKQPTNPYHNR